MKKSSGPLVGVKVLEFPAIGPVPFCGMLLSDYGADVLRIDRQGAEAKPNDVAARGKRSIAIDLKHPTGFKLADALIVKADVLIEGFRPGVMEKLGFGPDRVLKENPRLIYGRMTGWGQVGPLAQAAGHDINYVALAGALASMGPASGPPCPPLNLVGDYGGGALYLALGIVTALFERSSSGMGQVVDAAMIDGISSLMSNFTTLRANGKSSIRRGDNFLDGSAHFYRAYECADQCFITIGALEPHFYQQLWEKLAPAAPDVIPGQGKDEWARGTEILAAIFKTKTRAQWCALLEGTDICFAPVMEFDEAPQHPHMLARNVFVNEFGITQPSPAPRFSRTPAAIHGPPPVVGAGVPEALEEWGIDATEQAKSNYTATS
jgi:alpha-methylacyl-CoA racemase